MRVALRAREVEVPRSRRPHASARRRSRWPISASALRVDDNARRTTSVPAGRIMQQDPPAGVQRPAAAHGPRLGQLRAARPRVSRRWSARPSAPRSSASQQDGLEIGLGLRVPLARLPRRRRRRAGSAADARAPRVSLLLNRGEQAIDLRDARRHRHGRRRAPPMPCAAAASASAIVGSQPYPGVPPGTVVRQQPAGGFQVGRRRCDLARGEPVSRGRRRADRAVDPVGRLRRARPRHRRGRTRRRRPDSRGRDGRPLRPQHHHRPAGGARDQAHGDAARSTCT